MHSTYICRNDGGGKKNLNTGTRVQEKLYG
jgi:hypothetical protein